MDKSADEWVAADAVDAVHIANFEKRKAKKGGGDAAAAAPKPQEEKKRKAEDGEGGEDGEEDAEEGSKLEYSDGGIGVEAGEVDASLIITGPRRKRAAAARAEQSSDWNTMLTGKLDGLADSDSDDD